MKNIKKEEAFLLMTAQIEKKLGETFINPLFPIILKLRISSRNTKDIFELNLYIIKRVKEK